jgi:predicted Ser/Thr protein kinase
MWLRFLLWLVLNYHRMICTKCSRDIPGFARACPGCGAAVDAITDDGATEVGTAPATPAATPVRSISARPSVVPAVASRLTGATNPAPERRTGAGAAFPPGTTIASRYRVVNLLGKGGMGEVYRAEDLTLDQEVALKFLPGALASDTEALARFHSEVRIARQIAHPNVCRVYDIGEADGRIFLTMEYIDGEDLAGLLRRIGRLPSDKALQLARQLCAGLAAAHDADVLHRDLKPANIMIDGRGRAHITDFGIAGLAADLKDDHSRAGTPAYMAPEQLEGKGVSVQSDIFSLGLILYEMFTGRRAFEASTVADLIRVHDQSSPSRPSTLVGDIDPLVERVILRCLERDPRARPKSALTIAAQLPGGDPVAAALAAGETPSPEMVAASGGEGALELRTAWVLLGAALLGIAAIVAVSPVANELGLAPPEKSPDVLVDHAQDVIRKGGYKDPPRDSAFWFTRNYPFLIHRARTLPKSQQFGDLKSAEQSPELFFYRQSPRAMFPNNFSESVDYFNPSMNVSNMVMLATEQNGALIFFVAVPPQLIPSQPNPAAASSPAATSPADWPLFAESHLDPARFQPETPVWLPPVPFDTIAGWRGSYAQSPDMPIHVVAAAYRGHPVYFDLIPPWSSPERETKQQGSARGNIAQRALLTLVIGLFMLALVLAWRNWRLGRADLNGAIRMGAFILCVRLATWVLRAHHIWTAQEEWLMFILGAALGLWSAALGVVAYIALEPYVRRRWPQAMTSWSRLLTGRIGDPLVGCDLLIGVALGSGVTVVLYFVNASLTWFNLRGETSNGFDAVALGSISGATAVVLATAIGAVVNSLGIALFIFVLRVLIKRQWVAEAVAIGATFPFFMGSENLWLDGSAAFVLIAATVLSCSRRGILTLCAYYFTLQILGDLPITSDPSQWYFNRGVLAVAVCAGLAVYGFRSALAGKPAFGSIFAGVE